MKQHAKGFLGIVTDAKSRITQTTVSQVKKMLDNKEKFTFVDVREESEWEAGHLPHAIHLSKGVIERDIEKMIPDPNTKLVLYCGGGFRSALATDNIQKMGYKNVLSMDGGFSAWKEAGLPISR
ncbi:MAG: sulfurtransferase [Coxiella sp. RIFCSPHIGHO2_12_FULL_42_15]|nr:MAG: sulfurtransferase [Coxiella sp. RIFCSPHIGHO2_12_FULL_42_15]